MKKLLKIILLPILSLYLTGCAGLFVAGAATAVYFVTDPRSNSELLNDQDISLQINALGNKAPYRSNVRVSANTFNGNTLLMGQAVSQSYKDSLEEEVRKIKGVNIVHNQLKVKPLLSISQISNDSWITTKVKSAFLADSEIRDIKITVYTEDKEVFLVGSISPYHADKAVDIARNVSSVEKVIKVFYHGENKNNPPEQQSETKDQPAPMEDISSNDGTEVQQEGIEVIPYIEPKEVDSL